jgi:hypothetical protein
MLYKRRKVLQDTEKTPKFFMELEAELQRWRHLIFLRSA